MQHLRFKQVFLTAFAIATLVLSANAFADAGKVRVLYAGSLAHVMTDAIGPAFEKASGGEFYGMAGGSNALAHKIRDKINKADVFISANPAVNDILMGADNGDWVSWYVTFMKSPLEVGYHPKSKFAKALQSEPWYEVLSENGVRIGRTDEELDPKGDYTVQALAQIAELKDDATLEQAILDNSTVYPEEVLVGRLQSGQLDAGFFYAGEAAAVGIRTVNIEPINIGATYTFTVLDNAENHSGGVAFINFLLSEEGQKILHDNGFDLVNPQENGKIEHIPQAIEKRLAQ